MTGHILTRVLLLLLMPATPVAAQQSFSLEQVLSAPFPTSLVSSSTGTVAWVFNTRGARNIWMARAPEWEARQVTAYPDDDGQEPPWVWCHHVVVIRS